MEHTERVSLALSPCDRVDLRRRDSHVRLHAKLKQGFALATGLWPVDAGRFCFNHPAESRWRSKSMDRILVIRGGAIGDFILTLPALRALRQARPNAHIEILGYRRIAALAENRFYAQAVRSIEYGPLPGFFAKNSELPGEYGRLFCEFRSDHQLYVRSGLDL